MTRDDYERIAGYDDDLEQYEQVKAERELEEMQTRYWTERAEAGLYRFLWRGAQSSGSMTDRVAELVRALGAYVDPRSLAVLTGQVCECGEMLADNYRPLGRHLCPDCLDEMMDKPAQRQDEESPW